jgi:predicted ATPase
VNIAEVIFVLPHGPESSSDALLLTGKETPLIDRVEEMHLLTDISDAAIRGEGAIFFLHGEAGIGKTRLTRELRAYAHSQSMKVLYGRCPALFKREITYTHAVLNNFKVW